VLWLTAVGYHDSSQAPLAERGGKLIAGCPSTAAGETPERMSAHPYSSIEAAVCQSSACTNSSLGGPCVHRAPESDNRASQVLPDQRPVCDSCVTAVTNSKQFRKTHFSFGYGTIVPEPPMTLVRRELAKLHDPQVSPRTN